MQCIESGWISSEGPFVGEFESRMAARVNRRYGVAVANGSVALEVALACIGIGSGDEVILPSHTIISCASAIVRAGAIPVLVDSDPQTWNMRVDQIESLITSRTKAIMVVHLYGLPVEMDVVLEIAARHGLKIIEDAAEMIGQEYRGIPCGSFGDVSTFSFYPNKLVTTGEGGMVLVNEEELAEKARRYRNLCFQPPRRFVHEELGWNFRMTNMQAAVGLAQLERWEEFVARKHWIGEQYNRRLASLIQVQLPLECTAYAKNIYWVYGVVMRPDAGIDGQEAMRCLAEQGIGTRPFFWPMHRQPIFEKQGLFAKANLPVAETLAQRGFYLPSGLGLTEDQIERSAQALKKLWG